MTLKRFLRRKSQSCRREALVLRQRLAMQMRQLGSVLCLPAVRSHHTQQRLLWAHRISPSSSMVLQLRPTRPMTSLRNFLERTHLKMPCSYPLKKKLQKVLGKFQLKKLVGLQRTNYLVLRCLALHPWPHTSIHSKIWMFKTNGSQIPNNFRPSKISKNMASSTLIESSRKN